MTPKEKAEELYDKFSHQIPIDASFNDTAEIASKKIAQDHLTTKKFALIAVDEVIESHYKLLVGVKNTTYKYWQEVKEEIKKI